MLDALYDLGLWLNGAPPHFWARSVLRSVTWISPTIQSIHILSMAAVFGSAVLIDLRLLGLAARGQDPAEMARRLSPWMWTALCLMLATGALLVLNRPIRYADNPAFLAKLALMAVALSCTLVLTRGLGQNAGFWSAGGGRLRTGQALAAVSAICWVGVIIAGRWIAYA